MISSFREHFSTKFSTKHLSFLCLLLLLFLFLPNKLSEKYTSFTKCEVKMAEYWHKEHWKKWSSYLLFSTFLFSLFSLSLTLSVFPFSGSSKTGKSQKVFLYKQRIISAKENFRAPAWTLARFYLRGRNVQSRAGSIAPFARSGSQSEHRIRRILPARGACHIIKDCYCPHNLAPRVSPSSFPLERDRREEERP